MIDLFQPNYIVNSGIAGGVDESFLGKSTKSLIKSKVHTGRIAICCREYSKAVSLSGIWNSGGEHGRYGNRENGCIHLSRFA